MSSTVGEGSREEMAEVPQESVEDMLQRHKKEAKELQAKEMEMKKAAARGSKAEQKAKKKQVEESIAGLEKEMKERHAAELAALKEASPGSAVGVPDEGNGLAGGISVGMVGMGLKPLGGVPVVVEGEGGGGGGRTSKAQKRREKKAREEAERERRIEEEQSGLVSDRSVEDRLLAEQLEPQGLRVKEVRPDGHCLFRAIEAQLSVGGGIAVDEILQYDVMGLRRLAAEHMRERAEEFMPFLEADEGEGEGEGENDGGGKGRSSEERFREYCDKLENTAAWGGQLELQALAKKLKRNIVVFCAGKPNVEITVEDSGQAGGGVDDPAAAPIRLSYHHHAFGLGEHYNAVVPLEIAVESPEQDSES